MSDELHDAPVDLTADEPEEIVPDYSRVGFRDLRKLCTGRGLPAGGTQVDLIERLKAYDAERGLSTDTTVPDDADEVDLLADEDDEPTQAPTGAGVAASAPAPDGPPPSTPATPAAPAAPAELPMASTRPGRPNMATRDGVVKVGEGHAGRDVRAFRREYPLGPRDLTDVDHFRFIEQTHAAAQAEGYATKGGTTVGERVGYGADANGVRTVIYQVPLKRQQ